METERLISWVQDLDTRLTRRAFGAVGGALIAAGIVTDSQAGKKRKKKKKKKVTPKGDSCATGGCNRCKNEVCTNGTCACAAGMSRDLWGICGVPPTCVRAGVVVSSSDQCCSGKGDPLIFDENGDETTDVLCREGTAICYDPDDCQFTGVMPLTCRGYMCAPLYDATVGTGCPVAPYQDL